MSSTQVLPMFIAQRLEHILEKDWDQLSQLLDEELRYVHATGTRHNKATYLQFIAHGIQIQALEIQDYEIHETSEMTLLTGRLVQTIIRAGEHSPVSVSSWITEVWKKNSTWQLCAFQSTRES